MLLPFIIVYRGEISLSEKGLPVSPAKTDPFHLQSQKGRSLFHLTKEVMKNKDPRGIDINKGNPDLRLQLLNGPKLLRGLWEKKSMLLICLLDAVAD